MSTEKKDTISILEWEFDFSWEEYEKKFIEENRIERLRETFRVIEMEQVYIESATTISRKHLSTPFSC